MQVPPSVRSVGQGPIGTTLRARPFRPAAFDRRRRLRVGVEPSAVRSQAPRCMPRARRDCDCDEAARPLTARHGAPEGRPGRSSGSKRTSHRHTRETRSARDTRILSVRRASRRRSTARRGEEEDGAAGERAGRQRRTRSSRVACDVASSARSRPARGTDGPVALQERIRRRSTAPSGRRTRRRQSRRTPAPPRTSPRALRASRVVLGLRAFGRLPRRGPGGDALGAPRRGSGTVTEPAREARDRLPGSTRSSCRARARDRVRPPSIGVGVAPLGGVEARPSRSTTRPRALRSLATMTVRRASSGSSSSARAARGGLPVG